MEEDLEFYFSLTTFYLRLELRFLRKSALVEHTSFHITGESSVTERVEGLQETDVADACCLHLNTRANT